MKGTLQHCDYAVKFTLVDGMHSSKNNQPGWVGIGWSYEPGYIVHHLKTCNLPSSFAVEDLCETDEYSMTCNLCVISMMMVATSPS
ncbi:MAG: hypothetical protein AAF639_15265 [Chloroflexota bacterium]